MKKHFLHLKAHIKLISVFFFILCLIGGIILTNHTSAAPGINGPGGVNPGDFTGCHLSCNGTSACVNGQLCYFPQHMSSGGVCLPTGGSTCLDDPSCAPAPTSTPTNAPAAPTPTPAPPLTIYGAVFEDLNKNCVKDPNEKLLNDWQMFKGFSSQVNIDGTGVPAFNPGFGVTHTITDDVNYTTDVDLNSFAASLPNYVSTTANGGQWEPSSNACGLIGYASAPMNWSHPIRNLSDASNNRLRVDFPMKQRIIPACNTTCSSNADCSQVTDGCTACLSNGSGASTCQTPPTITPTPGPSCNSSCVKNSDCSTGNASRDGCVACLPNGNGGNSCQQPPTPTPGPSCNSSCVKNSDCSTGNASRDGCVACLPNGSGGNTCQAPVTPTPVQACSSACVKDSDCATGDALKNGCTACTTGSNGTKSCQPPVACNSTCTKDSDCNTGNALKNGCTACITGSNGTKSCQPRVACNSACVKDSDCNTGDALKNGCTACNTNANGSKTCQPPVACNSTCTKDSDCATGNALKNGCTACNTNTNGTKSCQPPVACNSTCTKDSDCAAGDALKNGCTACNTNANGTKSCQPPVACNSACVKDADCNSGTAVKNGCTSCLPNGSGGTSCQKNVACNSACVKDSDCNTGDALKNGCTTCINSSCQTFSPDMCSCDGIESTPIASGNNVTVTNFEKVVGGDINKAKVKDMTFYLTEGDKILAKSQPVAAAIDSSSAEKARFKSSWTVQIPANAKPNTDYRIFAQVNCVKKDALAYTPVPNRVVLGEQAPQNQNIFARFFGFITGIFTGRNVTPSQTGVTPTATATPTQTVDNPQLQIGTFSPSTSVEKSCRFIKFKFK